MPSQGQALPLFELGHIQDQQKFARRLNELIVTLDQRIRALEGPLVDPREPAVGQEVYAVTNDTEQRAFDADTVTHEALADVVGTLLVDLKNEGKLR